MSAPITMRCRRCQTGLTDDDEYCPTCNAGPLKALIPLGTMPNGHRVQLYLDHAEHGPQIAVLRAILSKFEAQHQALVQIRKYLSEVNEDTSWFCIVDDLTEILDDLEATT